MLGRPGVPMEGEPCHHFSLVHSSPLVGPTWYLCGPGTLEGSFTWPHGVLVTCPGPPELLFLFSPQSPPGSSKNPRTRSVCQGAWPPLSVRPRVTPSHG